MGHTNKKIKKTKCVILTLNRSEKLTDQEGNVDIDLFFNAN
jgi:hypothetical protein